MKPDMDSNGIPDAVKELPQERRWRDAIQELDRALETTPLQLSLWREKANALVALQSLDEALVCYDRMLEIKAGDFEIHAEKAAILEYLDRDDEAIASYRQALNISPSNVDLLSAIGRLLTRLKRTSEALAVYEKIGELDPQDPAYLIGIGDAEISAGQIDKAVIAFEQAARMDRVSFGAEEWTARGDDLLAAGKGGQALEFYEKAIQDDPRNATAYSGKAQVLRDMPEKSSEALKYFDIAIQLEPDNAWFQLEKGNIHYDRKENEPALACYTKAIELDPNVTMAWRNLGIVYEALEDYENALIAAEKVVELDPKSAEAWVHKGFCLGNRARPEESIASYREALGLDPNHLWANNNLGWMLFEKGKYEEALSFLQKAIEIDPTEAIPLVNQAKALIKLDRPRVALEHLNRGLEIVVDKGELLLCMAFIYSDFLFNDVRALECYAEYLKLKPTDQQVHGNIAECLIKAGRFSEGRAEAEKLVGRMADAEHECAMSLVILASYALEGDAAGRAAQFEVVLKNFTHWCAESPRKQDLSWNFGGMVNAIHSSSISAESKFLVLTAIDVHMGNLTRASLSFFRSAPPAGNHITADDTVTAGAGVEAHVAG